MRTNKIRGSVFLTDDNITHDIPHFRRVCQTIIDNGLNDMFYAVQVSAAGIANNPDLVKDMARSNKHDGFTCNTRTRHLSQSELYRCLKHQALRAYLTPSLIFQNYFIRNYLWSFLGGQIINLAATICYILRGNQGRTSLDLYP
jgi:hypothetical protein